MSRRENKVKEYVAELHEMIDKKKSASMEKMRAMENQLQASLINSYFSHFKKCCS